MGDAPGGRPARARVVPMACRMSLHLTSIGRPTPPVLARSEMERLASVLERNGPSVYDLSPREESGIVEALRIAAATW